MVASPERRSLAADIETHYLAGLRPQQVAAKLGCTSQYVYQVVERRGLRPQVDVISANRAESHTIGESQARSLEKHAGAKAEEYLARRLAGLEAKLASLDRVILDLPTSVGLDDLPVVVDALDRLDRIGRRTLGLGDGSGSGGKPTTAIQVNLLSSLQRPPDA